MSAGDDQQADAEKGSRGHAITVAVIGATRTVLAAIAAGVFALLNSSSAPATSNPGIPSTGPYLAAAPSQSDSESPPASDAAARITMPQNNAVLHGNRSVLIKGTARVPAGSQLWLFVLRYGIYYVSDIKSISIGRGYWQFRDMYVGNSWNTGKFQIDAMLANSSCILSIYSANPQPGGGVAFRSLPHGCRTLYSISVIRART